MQILPFGIHLLLPILGARIGKILVEKTGIILVQIWGQNMYGHHPGHDCNGCRGDPLRHVLAVLRLDTSELTEIFSRIDPFFPTAPSGFHWLSSNMLGVRARV